MRKSILPIAAGLACSVSVLHAANEKRPNIIVIFTDDLGYGDLACNGSKLNRTPNLDYMAANGIRFTDCYAAANVSTPSRAALLTGQYPIRTGLVDVIHPPSNRGIRAESITMAEMLKDAGYYTGMIGKWHLGDKKEFLPLQNGFQEYFGIPYSNDMKPCIYLRGNEIENTDVDQTQLTKTYTKETLRFLDENKSRPFFLYLAHNMPHTPLFASEQFKDKSANGLYGDVIEELDWSVGEVMKKLHDLKIEENTLIVFSSDNGPWLVQGKDAGSPAPYFQGKFTTWEGGHRVPTIAYWKGTVKPKVYTGLCTLMDWFPTFASLGKAKLPTDRIIDGQNLSNVLLKNGKRKNEEFYFFLGATIKGYRSGDYKILNPEKENVGKKNGTEVFSVPAHAKVLYNVRKDVHEDTDLSAKDPKRMEAMFLKMEAFQYSIKDLKLEKDPSEGKRVKQVKAETAE